MPFTDRSLNNPKRNAFDYYPTPPWAVHRLLEAASLPGGKWFEPCAGDGAIIRAVQEVRKDVTWEANEIQPEMKEKLISIPGVGSVSTEDYLQMNPCPAKKYNVIITNPPFQLAMECILQSEKMQANYLVFLLRLNFLASKTRAKFMSEHTPDVFVLSSRPSFISNGKHDCTDYAWFIWDVSKTPNTSGKLVVIPNKDKT